MISIHSLAYSRAIRLVWLMEDLGQPYNLMQVVQHLPENGLLFGKTLMLADIRFS